MLTALVLIAVLVVIWGTLWRSQPKLAFGILLGLPLAWLASRLLAPYLSGAAEIPVWLPPLPFAVVAVTLLVFGALVWRRADDLPAPRRDAEPQTHGDSAHH